MLPSNRLRFPFLSILILCGAVLASSGDRSPDYTKCIKRCEVNRCDIPDSPPLPFVLRLTRWTCEDDCKYACMHSITERAIRDGGSIRQYHGKWPFWRFAGMQEPASVLFSVLNGLAHARGISKVRRKVSVNHPMRSYYITWGLISVMAWLWSSVFHTRDLPQTEKLDYFCAALAIMYALYYTAIRLFHLYPQSRRSLTSNEFDAKQRSRTIWGTICSVAYIGHVTYLSVLPRFDYAYNMAFNLVVGFTHNLLWLAYSFPSSSTLLRRFSSQPRTYRPPYAWKAAVFVLLTTAATGLELFDFPPWWGAVDAHALWHMVTVPIAVMWYDFLIDDANDVSWRQPQRFL